MAPLAAFVKAIARTRWLVCSGLFLYSLADPTIESFGLIFGLLINAVLSKSLKRLFGHRRPAAHWAEERGHGFPSSHAQALFFLSTIISLRFLSSHSVLFYSFIFSYNLFFLALLQRRVATGLHTVAQIVAGIFFGILFGSLHFYYGFPYLRWYFGSGPVLEWDPQRPDRFLSSAFILFTIVVVAAVALERRVQAFLKRLLKKRAK